MNGDEMSNVGRGEKEEDTRMELFILFEVGRGSVEDKEQQRIQEGPDWTGV